MYNPEREVHVTASMIHDNAGYTPYEGMHIKGWPVITISRGEVVCEHGEVKAAKGRGRFLRCDRPAPARPMGRYVGGFDPGTGQLMPRSS